MIDQLLAENEGKTIEFKETARSLSGIMKTVVAFANSAGGIIVIGVKDKTKELVGLPQILSEEERLANAITDSILPLLTPDIEIQSSRGKELLIIRVSHGTGPYYLKSEGSERGVYVRFGSTNRVEYLKKENSTRAKMAMKLWKVSSRTARNRLKQLQKQGIIVRIGTSENDPSATYIVAKHS